MIAHELTHALDDQAVGLDERLTQGSDDASTAYTALVEGVATEVMFRYLARYFRSDVALGGVLGGAFASGGTDELPPFILDGLTSLR